jgi:hypothetical protein
MAITVVSFFWILFQILGWRVVSDGNQISMAGGMSAVSPNTNVRQVRYQRAGALELLEIPGSAVPVGLAISRGWVSRYLNIYVARPSSPSSIAVGWYESQSPWAGTEVDAKRITEQSVTANANALSPNCVISQ